MSIILDNDIIKAHLRSLGFLESEPPIDGHISTNYNSRAYTYPKNKENISMTTKQIYNKSTKITSQEIITFIKDNIEARVTYHPERDFKENTTIHSNVPNLESKIKKEISTLELPKFDVSQKIQQQLDVIYWMLLEYKQKIKQPPQPYK